MRVIAITLLVIACANGEDTCFHKATNTQGICLLLINCTYAYEGVLNQVDPQVCSLAQTAPIVCCPIDTVFSTTTTRPITTAASVSTTTFRPISRVSTTTARPVPATLSSRKCLEYSEMVIRDQCRIKDLATKVEHSTTNLGDFPHIAAILFHPKYVGGQPSYKCFGSLISERFVLIPAHCYYAWRNQPIEVHLGLTGLTFKKGPNLQKFKIQEFKLHPPNNFSAYNDLALLQLDGDVKFNQYVHPICLGDDEGWEKANPVMAGWTMVNETDSNVWMEQIGVEVASTDDCEKAYKDFTRNRDDGIFKGILPDKLLCASNKERLLFAPGSPLQIRSTELDCMYTLVGSLSFGMIHPNNPPAIITRIQNDRQWIESIVWP